MELQNDVKYPMISIADNKALNKTIEEMWITSKGQGRSPKLATLQNSMLLRAESIKNKKTSTLFSFPIYESSLILSALSNEYDKTSLLLSKIADSASAQNEDLLMEYFLRTYKDSIKSYTTNTTIHKLLRQEWRKSANHVLSNTDIASDLAAKLKHKLNK